MESIEYGAMDEVRHS